MAHSGSDRDLIKAEISSEFLRTRLHVNQANSRLDFNDWLFARLKVHAGESVLDVGCGTGSQSVVFSKIVGPHGRVCATDISPESVAELRKNSQEAANLETAVADMVDLASLLSNKFTTRSFDLVHSSYALYYASNHHAVLNAMKSALRPAGRMAVFSPYRPHGMVELARQFSALPAIVEDSVEFGPATLEPWFRANFWEVEVHFFQNELTLKSLDDMMAFYRAANYYRADVEPLIEAEAQKRLQEHGELKFAKSGYLIIGSDKR